MANEYIDPSGLNYAIPQSFVGNRTTAPVQAAQTPDVSMLLPKADEELAHVNGLADAYFNQYGMLKRFTEEMARKGIDVMRPQPGEPGGGELFKTYLGLEADLRTTANMLKREKEQRAMLSQKSAEGKGGYVQGFDPTTQVGVQQNLQDIWVPNDLLPEVKQMRELSQTVTNTEPDRRKFVEMQDRLVGKLQEELNNESSPARRQFLQNNIKALTEVRPATTPYAAFNQRQPSASQLANDQKNAAAFATYTQIANKMAGVIEDPTFELDKDFNVVAKDGSVRGTNVGTGQDGFSAVIRGKQVRYPLILDSFVMKDGKKYAKYIQPQELMREGFISEDTPVDPKVAIPDEQISNALDFTKRVIKNNKQQLGFDTTNLLAALEENKILDPKTKFAQDELVIDKSRQISAPSNESVKKEVSRIKELMKEKIPPFLTLPSNQTVEIKKHTAPWNKGYYVEIDGVEQKSEQTPDQVIEYLRQLGYFDQFLQGRPVNDNPFLN